jgi:hypothetical protein
MPNLPLLQVGGAGLTSGETIQALLEAVKAIGAWNVILVILVLGIIVNLPTIIKGIGDLFAKKEKKEDAERMQQNIGEIKQSLENVKISSDSAAEKSIEVKGSVEGVKSDINIIGHDLETLANERRREHSLIIDNMDGMNTSLDIIHKNMRNVMSEKDTIGVIEYYLGVKNSFRNSLMARVMTVIEELKEEKSGQLSYDIKKTLDTVWLEFLNEIDPLNAPISLKDHFETYTEDLWKADGMFSQIVTLALNDYPIERIKNTISLSLDNELRLLHSKLAQYLQKIKESKNRGE